MKLFSSIKRIGKRALTASLALTLGASFFGASALAQEIKKPELLTPTENVSSLDTVVQEKEEKQLPKRKFTLDFANPITDFEANSNAWYSANQLVGVGNDLLGVKSDFDDNIFGRIALELSNGMVSYWLRAGSHEVGHTRGARMFGDYSLDFEFNSFFNPGGNFPREWKYIPTDEQHMIEIIAGLNQDEFNAYTVFKNSLDGLTFDNGLSLLFTKLWDIKYNLRSGEDDPRSDDVKEYLRLLNKKGIRTSKGDHLTQALIADLLSIPVWESLKLVLYDYPVKGKRSIKPVTFEFGGITFTPSLTNFYLTPEGGFYDTSLFVNHGKKHPIEIKLGGDVDFIGDGELDTVRFGGQYHNINLWKGKHALRLHPFLYLDFNDSGRYKGISAGTEADLKLLENVWLRAKAGYHKNDVIENTVMGKGNGVDVFVGITVDTDFFSALKKYFKK